MHRTHNFLIGRRARDAQHFGMQGFDVLSIIALAHTASDDDFAIFFQGFANGIQRLLLGAVDEATGVNDHDLGVFIAGHNVVPVHLELGKDALGIYQRFGAAQ